MSILTNIYIDRKVVYCLFFVLITVFSTDVLSFENFEEVRFVKEIKYKLVSPVDVAVNHEASIFVLDQNAAKVFVYEKNGDFKSEFGGLGEGAGQFKAPQSIAVMPDGNVVVADTGHNRIQVFNKVGNFLFQFGQAGAKPGHFRTPQAVAVDHYSFIYVLDRDNRRVQRFSPRGVYLNTISLDNRAADIAIDLERNLYVLAPEVNHIAKYSSDGKKLREMACRINGTDYTGSAQAIAVDVYGDIILSENNEHGIKKIDQDGNVLASFGSEGQGRGRFNNARGVAVDKGSFLFIADADNARLQILELLSKKKENLEQSKGSPPTVEFYSQIETKPFSADVYTVTGLGVYILNQIDGQVFFKAEDHHDQVIARLGENTGELLDPAAVSVTLNGEVYVVDRGNSRIQIFNSDGRYEYHFGKKGVKAGQFNKPQGISVNSKGNIYVADTYNQRIQIFTNDGIYLKSFGQRANASRGEEGHLQLPTSLAIDSGDNVFVLDQGNSRVQVFNEYGDFIRTVGRRGNGPGQFENPTDIFIDENDTMYVADNGNSRIQLLTADGEFILAFGAYGEGNGYFKNISGVSAAQNKIYVADYDEEIVEVFRHYPSGLAKEDRHHSTKTATPPQDYKGNDVLKYSLARREAVESAVEDLIGGMPYSLEYISQFITIDSVQVMKNGQVKVTASIPIEIPPEPKPEKIKDGDFQGAIQSRKPKRKKHPWDW